MQMAGESSREQRDCGETMREGGRRRQREFATVANILLLIRSRTFQRPTNKLKTNEICMLEMNVRNMKQKTRVACFQAYSTAVGGSEPANRAKAKQIQTETEK